MDNFDPYVFFVTCFYFIHDYKIHFLLLKFIKIEIVICLFYVIIDYRKYTCEISHKNF